MVRLPIPDLSEERRIELKKIVKSTGEKCKISIRNIRRDANDELKALLKSKEILEEEEKKNEKIIQNHTDNYINSWWKSIIKRKRNNDYMNSPKHVAIIMDGNGRWGLKKKKSRNYGHKQGLETVDKIINSAIKKKIKFLTLFVFSTENWKRPKKEITYLFELLDYYIDNKINNLLERNVRIKVIGDIKSFPKLLIKKIKLVEKKSLNKKIHINMALNYGSRQEILKSIKNVIKKKISINEKNITNNLYTKNIPDPDILIRTGNTNRISNFLIWQSIYTEIFFVKKLWPDFNQKDFNKIINKFNKIKRNFGGLDGWIN